LFRAISHPRVDEQVLQQRQVLSLPGYDIINPGTSRKGFRYLDAASRTKKFKHGSSYLFDNFQVQKGKWGEGEYVSLDTCTCSEICPTGFASLVNLSSWNSDNKPEYIAKLSVLLLLAMLPTAFIIVLYVFLFPKVLIL
jgi:hypothetical protein